MPVGLILPAHGKKSFVQGQLRGEKVMFSVCELMDSVYRVQQSSFPELLKSFLDERGVNRTELYDYLVEQDFLLEKTSMYRYFNTTNPGVARLPEPEFLRHFAAFLNLSREQESALIFLYEIKRTRRKAG
jgi:hypothetical protein